MKNNFLSIIQKPKIRILIVTIFVTIMLLFVASTSFSLFADKSYQMPIKILLAVVLMLLTIILGILFKAKPNFYLFSFYCIFLVINIFVISLSDSEVSDKFLSFATSCVIPVTLYLTYSLLPKCFSKKTLLIVFFSFLIFAILCCLYSAVAEFENIIQLFNRKSSEIVNPDYQIKSFFTSKNAFGFILLVSFFISVIMFLEQVTYRKYFCIIASILTIFIVLSMCKTAIIFCICFYIYIAILYFCKNRVKKPILSYTLVLLVAVTIFVFVLCITVESIYSNFPLANYIKVAIFENGYRSISERIMFLSKANSLFCSPQILTGYGFKICLFKYWQFNGMNAPIDCYYYYSLLSGGIVFFAIIILTYTLSIQRIFFLNKDRTYRALILFIVCSLILLGLFENIGVISSSADSILLGLVMFTWPGMLLKEQRNSCESKQRVLHVVGSLEFGGTEAFIYNYLVQLKQSGIQFDIYCFNNINEEVRLKFENAGCKIIKGVKPSKRNLLKARIHFGLVILKNHYRSIHLNANFDNAIYSCVANENFVGNIICHAHDTLTNIKFSMIERIIMKIKRLAMQISSNQFLACSVKAGNDIFGEKFFTKKGQVILNGVSFEQFMKPDIKAINELKKIYKIPENKIVLGNITRFEPKKNQEFLINLFSNLPNDYVLILGGVDGGQLKYIEKLASKNNYIIFIGQRNDVKDWLYIFDYYLFPSLFEGLGIVAVESQLSGTKAIASKFVPDEANLQCELFEKYDLNIEEWARAIKEKPIKKSIDFEKPSVKRYDIKVCKDKLIKIYETKTDEI